MNWLQLGAVQLHWAHEISQGALAAAVAALGVVILLELRSIARLRRAFDSHLSRLFEQLDLVRFESQQLAESQARSPSSSGRTTVTVPGVTMPSGSGGSGVPVPCAPPPAGSGEARLMAAIAAARARLARSESNVLKP